MALSKKSLFQRLTQLFRSGPVIRRKIRTTDTTVAVPDREKSSAALLLQKSQSPTYSTITANAYNISERLARFQDFVEMELCLSGDTLIAVPGGYRRIDDLAADCDKDPDKKFVVYAYDHNEKKIVPALGKQARQTVVTDAWKVTFDSGKSITGTSNHRLMLRDGTYCTIGDLKIGDSMMPFYRRDLYAKKGEEKENDYNWIYTMDKNSSHRGWVTEHRVMGEWIMQRSLADNEVVHHVNFNRADNRPENLVVMDALEHQRFHAKILNGKKWSQENSDWIKTFKANHSEWMKENNPATRHDITFGRVLETCERVGFNTTLLCNALDVSMTAITNRLQQNGFKNFETFAKAYNPQWRSDSWCNKGKLNPRFDHTLTFDLIAKNFTPGLKVKELSAKLNTTSTKVLNRLRSQGFSSYKEFAENFNNHKVVSVEYVGVMPLYDLTVDGYKNFSTDSVISHNTPEISAALDLWADESVAQDEKGRVLHVYSDNEKIKELLEDLFYGTLNVEFNLRAWVRNLCKYGDQFLLIDVSPNFGVSNVFPIPVNEIEREENFDPGDPFAVRFRWVTLGNRTMENWEVAHLRLLGNDMFLPYGTSMIEAARRVWRQLILAEDAMLVYRVVRAPERRVFYIDVGNLPANEIEPYMEEQKAKLRTSEVVDRESGRVDLRHNPISILEDFFIGVRGTETGTKIDTLSGGQNTAAVEDVAYIQKKLIAALKIPRAYLGFDESLSSKSTLAQLDIRLSRTVNVIQKTVISELNKIAIIHLFANGFSGDDLQNFVLRLSNPSTVAQQQKLELWRTKFDIGGLMPENMGSAEFVQREIWGLNTDQINNIKSQRIDEKAFNDKLEAGGGGEGGDAGGGADLFGGGGGGFDEPMGDEEPTDSGEEQPPAETAADEPEELDEPGVSLLTSADDEFEGYRINDNDGDPVKPNARIKHSQYNHSRRRTHGASKTHMPDFNKMTGYDRKTSKNVYDDDFLKSLHTNPLGESVTIEKFGLAPDVLSMLKNFTNKFGSIESRNSLLSESMDDIDDSILESDDSYDDLNENELVIVEDDFNDPQED
jgi:hypothetical protein